ESSQARAALTLFWEGVSHAQMPSFVALRPHSPMAHAGVRLPTGHAWTHGVWRRRGPSGVPREALQEVGGAVPDPTVGPFGPNLSSVQLYDSGCALRPRATIDDGAGWDHPGLLRGDRHWRGHLHDAAGDATRPRGRRAAALARLQQLRWQWHA